MASRKICIKVPVDTYLAKYMKGKLGGHPYHLKKESATSIMIIGLLHPRTQDHLRGYTSSYRPNDHFVFTISESTLAKTFNCSINEQNFLLVTRMMKQQFYADLYLFLESRMNTGARIVIKHSIFEFLNKYDIGEEDLRYDTVRRAVDRYFSNKKHSQFVYLYKD